MKSDKQVRVDILSYNILQQIADIKGWTLKKAIEMATKELEKKVKSEPHD